MSLSFFNRVGGAACAIVLIMPCQALLDLDGDGMSDVWEKLHGFSTLAGQTTPVEQAPGADPDGDGYSNWVESQMVTDPHSGLSGNGTLRPAVEKLAGYQNLFTLTWPTHAEQWYFVYASMDLTPGSWFYVAFEYGTGDPAILGIEALDELGAPPDKLFWKIEVHNGDWEPDGLDDFEEEILGTNPFSSDSDGDGMRDRWEVVYDLNPTDPLDALTDADADGLDNLTESRLSLVPMTDDTDGDGILDGDEDADKDGLSNLAEATVHQTDPRNPDTDLDGLPDSWEITWSFNPKSISGAGEGEADADGDGLSNFDEYLNGTNPRVTDSDGDGTNDSSEVDSGGDPNNNSDQGQAPPAEVMVDMPFTVSDPSGSHSEKWKLTITGRGPDDTRSFGLASPDYGQQAVKTFKLRKWNRYEITIQHAGTDPDYLAEAEGKPDYDWEASVDGRPGLVAQEATADRAGFNNYFSVGQNHWLVENREAILTTEKHGDDEDIASRKKAYLIPVKVKDNLLDSGVDEFSVKAKPDALGYQDKFWIMAPAGGPAYTDHSLFDITVNTPTPMKITCPNATPDPETITIGTGDQTIAWTGAGSDPSDNDPTFKVGEAEDEVTLQIGVKSMKKRLVKVAVHRIKAKASASITLMPTEAQIEQELDRVYGWQINAYFDVDYKDEKVVDFDIADASMWPSVTNYPRNIPLEDHDGRLETFPPNDTGPEVAEIASHKLVNYDINVFVIGGASPFEPCSINGNAMNFGGEDNYFVGVSYLNEAFCIVDGNRKYLSGTHQGTVAGVVNTITHEIGHIMIGKGHPDQGGGPAPLDSSALHPRRVMCSGSARAPDGRLLLKAEWDAAESWLKSRPNDN